MKKKILIISVLVFIIALLGLWLYSKIDWCSGLKGELTPKCDAQIHGKFVSPF